MASKKTAVKKPGALTKAVGGKPSKNLAKVQKLAAGKGKTAKQAQFYLNVLRPSALKRKK